MRIAMYCDRPPRSGIGVYSTELHAALRKLGEEAELTFTGSDYDGLLDEKSIHHGTDATLSWLVPRTKKPVITLHDIDEDGRVEVSSGRAKQAYLAGPAVENIKKAAAIITDSYDARNRAVRAGMPEDILHVVHLGTDTDTFRPYDGNRQELRQSLEYQVPELASVSGRRMIVSVSSEEPRKSIPDVLRAFAKIRKAEPKTVLLRVGYPKEQQSESNIALQRELGISDSVVYLNNIGREHLTDIYKVSELMLFPTVREGFGLAFTEAMASGCPIVAYSTTTAPEIVGSTGLLTPLEQGPDGLAESSLRMLADPELRNRLANASRRRVEELFTWNRCASNTAAVYKVLMGA